MNVYMGAGGIVRSRPGLRKPIAPHESSGRCKRSGRRGFPEGARGRTSRRSRTGAAFRAMTGSPRSAERGRPTVMKRLQTTCAPLSLTGLPYFCILERIASAYCSCVLAMGSIPGEPSCCTISGAGICTLDELKARIAKTISFVRFLRPDQLDGSEEKDITLKLGGTDTSAERDPL